jgi:hypothetical protein
MVGSNTVGSGRVADMQQWITTPLGFDNRLVAIAAPVLLA